VKTHEETEGYTPQWTPTYAKGMFETTLADGTGNSYRSMAESTM
jgi:hypothetical protein